MYNAFISYSHTADDKFASSLQKALQKFAKPWYKKRSLEIFRDESSLSVSPHLWENITQALDNSEYLILLGSSGSENSHWVNEEVKYWLEHKSLETILICLTEGEIEWDMKNNCFLNPNNNSLPPALDNQFVSEPFYIDLRKSKTEEDVSLENPIFKKEILKLAAQIHHKSPNDLASEEVTVHRKWILFRNAVAGILGLLFIISIVLGLFANSQRKKAENQMKIAQANFLMIAANKEVENDATLALRLASKAISLTNSKDSIILSDAHKIYIENALYKAVFKHSDEVVSVAFSPDGSKILTGSRDSIARLWDIQGNQIGKDMKHLGAINSIAFSPDDTHILTGSNDKTAKLWDLQGNQIGNDMKHSGAISIVAFSPDGTTILTGSSDNTARLWNLMGNQIGNDMKHTIDSLFAYNNGIYTAAFSPDGTKVLTGSRDETARLWDLQGNQIGKNMPNAGWVKTVAFSPDGKIILTGSRGNTARLWDLQGNQIGKDIEHPYGNYRVSSIGITAVAFSPDGKRFLTAAEDNIVRLWSIEGFQIGEDMKHPGVGYGGLIESLAFSPNGNIVLTGSRDGVARLWNVTNFLSRQIGKDMKHMGVVNIVAFSPDGSTVLTGSSDNTARLWEVSNQIGKDIKESNPIRDYSKTVSAFSPDSTKEVRAFGNFARLLDLQGNQIGKDMKHSGPPQDYRVNAVAFSPDGAMVLTGADDRTARLWDLHGNQIGKDMEHFSSIYNVSFSADGSTIITNSGDDIKQIWKVVTLSSFLKSDDLPPLEKLLLTNEQKKKYEINYKE